MLIVNINLLLTVLSHSVYNFASYSYSNKGNHSAVLFCPYVNHLVAVSTTRAAQINSSFNRLLVTNLFH